MGRSPRLTSDDRGADAGNSDPTPHKEADRGPAQSRNRRPRGATHRLAASFLVLGWARMPRFFAAATLAAALALAGCGSGGDEQPPVACLDGTGAYLEALADAP